MRKCKLFLSLIIPTLLTGCFSPSLKHVHPLGKDLISPVVAVTSFDNRSSFSGQWKLGSGMADLLVSELKSANFVVLERAHLKNVIGELRMQKDKLFRNEGKVEHGRLKNARYLIRGVINDFDQVGGGSFGIVLRSLAFGGRGYTARVSLTLTIVDVESGEIVDSIQATGTARARNAYANIEYKNVRFGGDVFFKTPLGVATSNAIRQGVKELMELMPIQAWLPMIADISDKRIMINGGENRNVKENALYIIREKGTPITDPLTGDILKIEPGPYIGTVRITEVNEKISYATIVDGSDFHRGQQLIPHPSD